jgi:hypothetical protein
MMRKPALHVRLWRNQQMLRREGIQRWAKRIRRLIDGGRKTGNPPSRYIVSHLVKHRAFAGFNPS